jgi:nitrite reductase/ring-hydroxylating ferredoxin subunit
MREREARFPSSMLPERGAVRVVEVGTHRIGLYRVGDSVHALADRCPHRGAPLCAGAVATPIGVESGELTVGEAGSVVRCPWHKWEFDIASGRCTVDERLRVRRYTVRLEGDDVVVTLDAPPA